MRSLIWDKIRRLFYQTILNELNSIQEIIEDISQGKMVILMDDEDRENEGDLVLAAELVDAEAINFMATHARGLICLAINEDRCKTLGLEQMVKIMELN